MIPADRWNVVEKLFEQAVGLPQEQRGRFLAEACAGDPALRAELEAMLAADAADPGAGSLEDAVARAAEALLQPDDEPRMEGRRFGPYRIVREIGRGGMGRVFLAERDDAQYAGRVAVKLLTLRGVAEDLEDRFRTERQVLADLDHPGIARLLDAGVTEDGESYLVMEYVDGVAIDEYCESRRLSVDERVALMLRLCDAVQHAHRNLVVHRDIKASNVLVTADGQPKLLDFGIAKLIDADRARALDLHRTGDATRMLTPTTASPEQLRGEPVTTATDVYALGHLLYRLLTGRAPYPAGDTDPFALRGAILGVDPQRPSLAALRTVPGEQGAPSSDELAAARRTTPQQLARDLSGDLDSIVLKALRKEPDRRYPTPAQLAEDLARHREHQPVLARGDAFGYLSSRFLRRHRRPLGAALGVLVLVLTLIGFYTARLSAERDQARVAARRAEEVSAFLTDLFENATPEVSRGEEVTAREILDRGAGRIASGLRGEPEVQGSLMRVIGSAYGKLGLYEPATRMLEGAVTVGESQPGASGSILGDAVHDLGGMLLAQGRYAEADSLLRRALEIRRAAGSSQGAIAATLQRLATLKLEQADVEAAARYLDEADREAGALTPPDTVLLADLLLTRADLAETRGDFAAAVRGFEQAIELRRRRSGDDHPATLLAQNNLANALSGAGRMEEAAAVLRDILATRRRILPEGHPAIGYSLNNLASALKMQGRPAEAIPLQEEALRLFRGAYPADHTSIALSLNNLANLHHDLRDLDGAYALHVQALEMRRRLHGPDHSSLGDSYSNLAALQLDREEYAGALVMYNRTIELDRRTLGAQHPYVSHDLIAIGSTLGLMDRLDEAADTLRRALAETRRAVGEAHPQTANAMRELAVVLRRQGGHEEAAALLRAALPLFEKAYPGDPWETALARSHLGDSLARLGQGAEAEPLLRVGLARMQELRGADDRMTRDARRFLTTYLRGAGRTEEAAAIEAGHPEVAMP